MIEEKPKERPPEHEDDRQQHENHKVVEKIPCGTIPGHQSLPTKRAGPPAVPAFAFALEPGLILTHLLKSGAERYRSARASKWESGSGENVLHHLDAGFHPGEAHIEPLELVGELLVINAEEMQHGGVEVVNGDNILDRIVAKVIGGSVSHPALDATAGHPE